MFVVSFLDEWIDERKAYSYCRYKAAMGEIYYEGKRLPLDLSKDVGEGGGGAK